MFLHVHRCSGSFGVSLRNVHAFAPVAIGSWRQVVPVRHRDRGTVLGWQATPRRLPDVHEHHFGADDLLLEARAAAPCRAGGPSCSSL